MAGVLAVFASLSIAPNWEQQTTKKTYNWVDHSVITYEQLQKTQHCYTWFALKEKGQKSLQQDKK